MRREEDLQRTEEIDIPLRDVYQNLDRFEWKGTDPQRLCLLPRVFEELIDGHATSFDHQPGELIWDELDPGVLSISTQEQFQYNWSIFTKDQLKNIDWNNVFVAGGSVFACLYPIPESYQDSQEEYFTEVAFETSDIDIFLYGLTLKQSEEKAVQIFETLSKEATGPIGATKSKNTITIYRGFPYRCIQIIISNFKYKAEVLANLDLDNCCVGFDGNKVECLPRFIDAMNTRTNTINSFLKGISWHRIRKLQCRGFYFQPPNFLEVPFNSIETKREKLDFLLSIGKMKLLLDHGVTYDHHDAIRRWYREYAFGVSWQGRNRSLILDNEASTFHQTNTHKRGTLEWDGSCGMYGFNYFNGVTFDSLKKHDDVTDIAGFRDLWKQKSKKRKEKWSWDGAPEFNDWDFHFFSKTEVALLSFEPLVLNETVDLKKKMTLETERNPMGISWKIHLEPNQTETLISLEMNDCKGEEKDKILCSVIGIFSFGQEDDLQLDFCHHFTPDEPQTPKMSILGNQIQKMSNPIRLSVDVRQLVQRLPLV
eukprot:TRINITY_DN1754_c0_g1_i1.p1 TRINITY_DN1754_c0_g1~~TRINITY_DN1754_c0_g1_i1.p1  ORF type:complete len:629 (-),score=123.84 TRINITY_DN1754_c0_g1_i1:17-1630(-)